MKIKQFDSIDPIDGEYNEKIHSKISQYFDYVYENFDHTRQYHDYVKIHFGNFKESGLKHLSNDEFQIIVKHLQDLAQGVNGIIDLHEKLVQSITKIIESQIDIKAKNRNSKIDELVNEPQLPSNSNPETPS